MAQKPTGIGDPQVTFALSILRAFGEIQGTPIPQLDLILERLRDDLQGGPPPDRGPPE